MALELHEHQGNAVHEPHQVAAAPMQGAVHPQLLGGNKTVHLGMAEVEYLRELGIGHPVLSDLPHGDAIAQHLVLGLVGLQRGIAHERLRECLNCLGDIRFIHPFVELYERIFEVTFQQHIAVAFASKRAVSAKLFFVVAVMDVPAEAREQLAGRLLHGLLFGITVFGHLGSPASYLCGR